jgi:hypothetical protein
VGVGTKRRETDVGTEGFDVFAVVGYKDEPVVPPRSVWKKEMRDAKKRTSWQPSPAPSLANDAPPPLMQFKSFSTLHTHISTTHARRGEGERGRNSAVYGSIDRGVVYIAEVEIGGDNEVFRLGPCPLVGNIGRGESGVPAGINTCSSFALGPCLLE